MCPQPQPQTKVTLTPATLRQSLKTCKCFSKLTLIFFSMLLSKILLNLSKEAIQQKHQRTTITVLTLNNQTQQDNLTVITEIHGGRRGTIFFASSFSCTPDFCVFSISKLSATYAERHMQNGTMRSLALALTQTALGPSERQAAVCWLLSAKWGQFAVSGDAKVGVQGGGLNTGGRGRLDVDSGMRLEKPR